MVSTYILQYLNKLYCIETHLNDVEVILNLLQTPELKKLSKHMNLSISSLNKSQIIKHLLNHSRQHKHFMSKLSPLEVLIKK